MKRLAVILVEDVWLSDDDGVTERLLASLLGVGLATQRIPSYFPSTAAVLRVLQLAAAAVRSRAVVLWRPGQAAGSASLPGRCAPQRVGPAGQTALADAARLLAVLRSFDGD